MTCDALTEIIDLDLRFLEAALPGECVMPSSEEHGGMVEFTIKELLVDIRQAVDHVGETTKKDLAESERRLHDRIVLVDAVSKERAEAVEHAAMARLTTLEAAGTAVAASGSERMAAIERELIAVRLFNARVAGAIALATFLGAGVGATVVTLVH